ncbi:DUF2877 domain-containing protein [Cellulomonas sp. Sa3CUA2]|uniref:DUF2877 domain-containing protein n=1 Tax=Cellulomonas avistercoris TaxID=2762242 RepID=A0ABR8QG69_9CELL|nr:DUF2877 domain-containing protein [Cellulomonas avistercoris]MBD7919422.1 DUF2877 domain-containing protein [Cellulomonas avistercoris]
MSIPLISDARPARAAADAPGWDAVLAATVVHVGRTVVVLRTSGGLLVPVTSAAHGLVPGGVCLADDGDLDRVRTTPVGSRLDRGQWATSLRRAVRVDLTVRRAAVDTAAAHALAAGAAVPDGGGPLDPGPARSGGRVLVAAAGADDVRRVRRVLRGLVGVGPGSTPSGDDVVVGALAGLDRRSDDAAARAAAAIRRALPELLDRTTSLSQHDLRAALEGQAAERVHRLLEATADVRLVAAALREARCWGATSGLDLAAGVAAGARGPGAWSGRRTAQQRVDLSRTA